MMAYERLKTIRAVARHYRPAENLDSRPRQALYNKLCQAERALEVIAEMVDEYDQMIGKEIDRKEGP